MSNWQIACLVAYSLIVVSLSLYGLHRYPMLRLFFRHRRKRLTAHDHFEELPAVTVQLPMYNEFHVVERLLDAVAGIDYPRDRFQVQVLDDSQDDTRARARNAAQRLAATGLDIEYVNRDSRVGYKAGALAAGLGRASGEFVLILDADFVPNPDILQRSIHFFTDPGIGMVQKKVAYEGWLFYNSAKPHRQRPIGNAFYAYKKKNRTEVQLGAQRPEEHVADMPGTAQCAAE